MPVKRKPDQSIIEALNKAQHIAFGPVLFQAVRSALATGLLSHISEAEDTETEAARACWPVVKPEASTAQTRPCDQSKNGTNSKSPAHSPRRRR